MTKNRIAAGLNPEQVLAIKAMQSVYSGAAVVPQAVVQQPTKPAQPVVEQTEEEITEDIKTRFSALEDIVLSTAMGINRSLIVSGAPGLGKSFTVEQVLTGLGDDVTVTYIKGYTRPTGIYRALYENCHPNAVIVFDDCDSVFSDDTSLNLLKAACDSSDTRKIHWGSETNMKDEEGENLPRQFEFEGNIIFLTNYDFQSMIEKQSKLSPHFNALMSRSLYLDLNLKTQTATMVRIRQVVKDCKMLRKTLSEAQEAVLLDWLSANQDKVRELSLRTVKKVSTLMASSQNWQKLAELTILK
jgi:hypothetical protein